MKNPTGKKSAVKPAKAAKKTAAKKAVAKPAAKRAAKPAAKPPGDSARAAAKKSAQANGAAAPKAAVGVVRGQWCDGGRQKCGGVAKAGRGLGGVCGHCVKVPAAFAARVSPDAGRGGRYWLCAKQKPRVSILFRSRSMRRGLRRPLSL